MSHTKLRYLSSALIDCLQITGTEIIKDLAVGNTAIAHSSIYKLTYQDGGSPIPECPESEVCQAPSRTLTWHGEDICKASFICPRLKEKPCEEFGLTLSFPDSNELICHESQRVQAELSSGQTFKVSMWYSDPHEVDIECFMWCSEDGNVPRKHLHSEDDNIELKKLVSFKINSCK